ncbi:MAG: TetR family transcriptional regulator C-terminal domain-containing protein [Lachnospiraceae bacterium]|nr:TetR family transcriptional regulator C-terminal domain-containing protein [Lachnospiraceae bacterium]
MGEKKEDGRVRYTKMRIRSAFYELVKETDYNKITVTAVCNKAEINRATFYKHYLDIPDLIDKLQEEVIRDLVSRLDMANEHNMDELITDLLKQIRENLRSADGFGIFSQESASTFTSRISGILYSRFSALIKDQLPNSPDLDPDMIFAYIAGGCAGIVEYWVRSGFPEEERAISHKMRTLASSTIQSLPSQE